MDPDGTLAWHHIGPIGVKPGRDLILDALEEMATRRRMAGVGA